MASNAGTGRPMNFRCTSCRSTLGLRAWPSGSVNEVELTGRSKAATFGNAGSRNSTRSREYRCLCCGHVGWSRHTDLERKERIA